MVVRNVAHAQANQAGELRLVVRNVAYESKQRSCSTSLLRTNLDCHWRPAAILPVYFQITCACLIGVAGSDGCC